MRVKTFSLLRNKDHVDARFVSVKYHNYFLGYLTFIVDKNIYFWHTDYSSTAYNCLLVPISLQNSPVEHLGIHKWIKAMKQIKPHDIGHRLKLKTMRILRRNT